MKRLNLSLIVLACSLPVKALADMSFSATVVSDYMFRGVSQTDSHPAMQLSADYEHSSGLFAGVWGSNVDFGDDADVEVDLTLGYAGEVNSSFSFDVYYVYYTYTGYSSADEIDYGELIANGYYNNFTFTFGYADDYAQSDESAQYVSVAYDMGIFEDINLSMQIGYSFGDAFESSEYIDYSVFASKEVQSVELTAGLTSTDIDDDDNADLRFVVGMSYSF